MRDSWLQQKQLIHKCYFIVFFQDLLLLHPFPRVDEITPDVDTDPRCAVPSASINHGCCLPRLFYYTQSDVLQAAQVRHVHAHGPAGFGAGQGDLPPLDFNVLFWPQYHPLLAMAVYVQFIAIADFIRDMGPRPTRPSREGGNVGESSSLIERSCLRPAELPRP